MSGFAPGLAVLLLALFGVFGSAIAGIYLMVVLNRRNSPGG